MTDKVYKTKRNFILWSSIGFCAMTKDEFIKETFSMPTEPISGTINLVGVPAAISSKENKKILDMYNGCTMAAIDGMPIVKKARRKGIACERCAAPDIMGPVFEESIKREKTHYFYGGKNEQVLKQLKENLESRYKGINIVGMYSPPFRPLTDDEDRKICKEINTLNPDFVWVGIGAPKQEIWILNHREKIKGCVMLGVGAGFDFFAGTLDKAPKWMEQCSLEWFFRLIKEPKRLWKRYIIGGFKYIYYNISSTLKRS